MTVKELIKLLEEHKHEKGDFEIVLSSTVETFHGPGSWLTYNKYKIDSLSDIGYSDKVIQLYITKKD